jgi:hypothetical protein
MLVPSGRWILSSHSCPIGLFVRCCFGKDLIRSAHDIFVLAPLSVRFLAPAEHPHRSDCSLFLAKHAPVVADRLAESTCKKYKSIA